MLILLYVNFDLYIVSIIDTQKSLKSPTRIQELNENLEPDHICNERKKKLAYDKTISGNKYLEIKIQFLSVAGHFNHFNKSYSILT